MKLNLSVYPSQFTPLPIAAGSARGSTLLRTQGRRLRGRKGEAVSEKQFSSYDEFFDFYLQQHSNPANRALHATGTILGLGVVGGALLARKPMYALLFFPVGYGFAWTGHFLVEKNKPATFGHPLWSFVSDFRMLGLMLSGKLDSRLQAGTSPARWSTPSDTGL